MSCSSSGISRCRASSSASGLLYWRAVWYDFEPPALAEGLRSRFQTKKTVNMSNTAIDASSMAERPLYESDTVRVLPKQGDV